MSAVICVAPFKRVHRILRGSSETSVPITPLAADRLPPLGEELGTGSGQNALPRFPKGGLRLPKGSAKSTITLEAMSVAELLAADPLARGRAVACQLLTGQRWLPDDVDGAGLRGRSRSLTLRRSNAGRTGGGSGDEANSGEQRNDDTH
jgi:hypothetical protein